MPAGESEARAKTRDKFNEAIKKYTDPPSEKKKLRKKRTSEPPESIVLQTLKKNLEKDTEDDETALQNTYDPEQGSPRFTKNKRRERDVAEKVNNNTAINSSDGAQAETRPPRGKRKSKRELPAPPSGDDIQTDDTEDARALGSEVTAQEPDDATASAQEPRRRRRSRRAGGQGEVEAGAESQAVDAGDQLLREYQQQISLEEEESRAAQKKKNAASQDVALNNDVGKKKKKKLKSLNAEADVSRDQDETTEQDVETEDKPESKGRKKKRKKQVVREDSETEMDVPQRPVFDDSLVLGVYIHRTDRLKTDLLISHPMVKVHIVDEVSGQYVKKEDSHRPVSSFYEQDNVDHVLPIMTQPFDFKKNKSTVPEWDEQIIFNERFGYFLQDDDEGPRVILFFEVLDFMTMEEARANVDVDKSERGFRKVAWAFLKPVGANGVLNIDSKLRLQLYCPPARAKRQQPRAVEVVDWWRKHPRNRYASTLYVTVKGIKLPDHVDPCMRSMMALQEERGSTSYSELQSEVTRRTLTLPADDKPPVLKWSRMPGQVCRIPNKSVLSFRGGQMGCFTVRFSHAGTMLAAACADRDAFPVVVYQIPSGGVLAAFNGHLSIVYDLCWSRDDRSLLSASSDGTVRLWNVEQLLAVALKVLPHPSFVYCSQFHPAAPSLVVTGGFDSLLRVWRVDVRDVNGQLLQELDGHRSFINTACFDSEGRRMFTADNAGLIIVWRTIVNERKQQQPCRHWGIEKRIDESDLGGVPINMLEVHPNGRRLLIHAKDSLLRVMDLRILAVKKYTGATNYRERICSTFSPCGSFLFSGSEDGLAYVWNAETGDQVAVYSELCYPAALRGVAFHPHENMVAFCAFGPSQPVHVYLYDRKVSQMEAQSMAGASRSVSTDPKSFRSPGDPFQDTSSSAMEQFAQTARLTLKMQRVKDKLDSVLEPLRSSSTPGYVSEQDKLGMSPMGRRLTLDPGMMALGSSLPAPALLSPHSKLHVSGSLAEQLIPQAALSSLNRGFSPVGQRVRGSPSLCLQTSLPDHGPNRVDGDSSPVQQTVVSLYDYSANRSDELTVQRGDVIHVLYKDNDNWWFGRLADGQQGYFPATYVAEENFGEEVSHSLETQTSLSETTVDTRSTPTKVSAAISASGELKFLSEQDTDPELPDNKVKKKKKKVKRLEVPSSSEAEGASGTSSRRAARDRPLPRPPAGASNGAYEPDT